MTECVNYGLCYKHFTADRAMLALGKTGVYAIGCDCLVNNLGVTECVNGNSLAADFLAANSTISYVIIRACIGAVGSDIVLNNYIACGVTKSVNNSLCYKHFTAYRAMLALGKTGVYAIGSNCLVNNLGMTECVNSNSLAAKFCAANSTVSNIIVRTAVYTVRSNVVFYNNFACGVTECINNDSLAADFFAAIVTGYYLFVRTCGIAICGYFILFGLGGVCVLTNSLAKFGNKVHTGSDGAGVSSLFAYKGFAVVPAAEVALCGEGYAVAVSVSIGCACMELVAQIVGVNSSMGCCCL